MCPTALKKSHMKKNMIRLQLQAFDGDLSMLTPVSSASAAHGPLSTTLYMQKSLRMCRTLG